MPCKVPCSTACGHDLLAKLALRIFSPQCPATITTRRHFSTTRSRHQTNASEIKGPVKLGSAFHHGEVPGAENESDESREAALLDLFESIDDHEYDSKHTPRQKARITSTHRNVAKSIQRDEIPKYKGVRHLPLNLFPRTSIQDLAGNCAPLIYKRKDRERLHRVNGFWDLKLSSDASKLQHPWVHQWKRRFGDVIGALEGRRASLPSGYALSFLTNEQEKTFCVDVMADLVKGPKVQDVGILFRNNVTGSAIGRMWSYLMLSILQNAPDLAMQALIAADGCSRLPGIIIEDCLHYIAVCYLQEKGSGNVKSFVNPTTAQMLFQTIKKLLIMDEGIRGSICISNKTIYLLQASLNIDDLVELVDLLEHVRSHVKDATMFHIISRLAKENQLEQAMATLELLYKQGANTKSRIAESIYCTILDKAISFPRSSASVPDLFSRMLAIGLTPNIVFYNLLIRDSLKRGDAETAWRILDLMVQANIEPDKYTLSSLLNDAKWRNDTSVISDISRTIDKRGLTEEYLVTDLLHLMYLQHKSAAYEYERSIERESLQESLGLAEKPLSAFTSMAPLFARNFSLEPLQLVLPRSQNHDPFRDALKHIPLQEIKPKLPNSTAALTVMFIAYLRRYRGAYGSLTELYKRFRQLVLTSHPLILPLVQSSRIYDAFLMAFGSRLGTLPLCTGVISDMLHYDNNPTMLGSPYERALPLRSGGDASANIDTIISENGTAENHKSHAEQVGNSIEGSTTINRSFSHCRPSVYSWSILLKAYMDHKQPLAAEKVLELMDQHGVIPTQVTWNSLIIGYAAKEDIPNVVKAIERAEHQGFETHQYVLDALTKMPNRAALNDALEDMAYKKRAALVTAKHFPTISMERDRIAAQELIALKNALTTESIVEGEPYCKAQRDLHVAEVERRPAL